jgi:hypothetical protein
MAKINITHTSVGAIETPISGATNLFYDVSDGLLKQKDATGAVTEIGIAYTGGTPQFDTLGGVAITTPAEGDLLVYSSGTLVNVGIITNFIATNITGDLISGTTINSDLINVGALNATSIDSSFILSGGTDLGEIFAPIGSDTNTYTTGGTYSDGTATFNLNDGNTYTVTGFSTGGIFTGGTVTGETNFTSGLTSSTISVTSILSDSIDSLVLLSGGTDLGEIFQTIGSDPTLAFVPGSSGSNNAQQNNSTCTASGDFSVAMCQGASSDGVASLAIGFDCVSNSDYSFAGGYQSATNGLTSFVHSTNSLCLGDRSVIIGGQNITGTTNDTVYVPTIEIVNSGSSDTQIIMTDKADGLRYNIQLSGGT